MEKCAKCEEELGFNRLHINCHINEWLCLECNNLYLKELEVFNKNFIQPERSKREDSTNSYPDIMEEISKVQDKINNEMLRCGALNIMET